ncbi:DNA repair protein [Pseudoduganella eburnea]|uniref:DNA repair protein n=1 Tax=Massilia eburnea TaxID=1776165 RepID=A0A6L6QEJ6_9BURK|nr:DNA repair protein [Massilia eburnea]MTW10113.1 DNA repair protein [Massilia eburnea]
MTPLSLTLTGFKGIRDGLGRTSITIDFAELTQGAELVAITGRNGRGKSTILDNMTPYPVMPSKAGGDGLGAFSYYDEIYLPESQKELIWAMGDARYRSHIVIRDQGKRKTEAYLHTYREGRWHPVRLEDGTLSDGRMETYQRCVEGIAGRCATFLSTAFSAQNRRQLASFRHAEIKSLLADLLGLDAIRAQGEQANDTLRLLRAGLLGLRQAQTNHQAECARLDTQLHSLDDASQQLALARQNQQNAAERREARRAELARLTAWRESDSVHAARRQQLRQERRHAMELDQTAQIDIDQQERDTRAGITRLEQNAAQRAAQRELNLASQRAQLATLRRTIHSGRHVQRAVTRQALLRVVLQTRDQALAHAAQRVARHDAIDAEIVVKEAALVALEREAGQAALSEQQLRRRFGLTNEVPCSGTHLQAHCKLLADARAAKPLLPDASASIAKLEHDRQALRCALLKLKAQAALGAGVRDALRVAQAKRCRTEARLSWELQLAARQADIAQAKNLVTEIEERLSALLHEAPAEQAVFDAEAATLGSRLADLGRRRSEQYDRHRTSLARIDALLTELPPAFDDAALARAVAANAQAAAFHASAEQALEAALAAVQRREALQHQRAQCSAHCLALDRQISRVEDEIVRWSLFAKCMGNDGIIALAIDDAGPELSSRTNQLLLSCYGARFTVAINTQLANAKGDVKEGFEITVHDAMRNTSKNVAKMSGGERIWINECLTRAMALYLAEASTCRSSTLFSDEADGAFDAQHKRQFMAMKREVLRIGGYTQEYFISHTSELSAMADAVIDLDQYISTDVPID